jgi:2-haloacid dehalogenase
VELSKIRALTFDIGGTVFDWFGTVVEEVQRVAARQGAKVDAPRFANDWRRGMFALLQEVCRGARPAANSDALHREALDIVLGQHETLALSRAERDELNLVWHRLRAWEGAQMGIEQLRRRYTVAVLTVLSLASAVSSSKRNGIGWDAVISCEFLHYYKPDARAYHEALDLLGVRPDEAIMVSTHFDDLSAAQAAGLHIAYVSLPRKHGGDDLGHPRPKAPITVEAEGFLELARQIAP